MEERLGSKISETELLTINIGSRPTKLLFHSLDNSLTDLRHQRMEMCAQEHLDGTVGDRVMRIGSAECEAKHGLILKQTLSKVSC